MIANGKLIAKKMEGELAAAFSTMPKKNVCFVLFADDASSRQFIALKSRVAERLGIAVNVVERTDVTSTQDCLGVLASIVTKKYDGIVVQLPLPDGIDVRQVLNAVPEHQDIDVLSDVAKRTYENGGSTFPPVARAIKEIFDFYHVSLDHKKIIVIGKGKLVGEPVSVMLSHMHIPYEILDTTMSDENRAAHIASADIIISGVGLPYMITPDMVKPGVVLVDAGTSEQGNKLVGDIDPACVDNAALMTPVPGGVGPVTVVSLFANLL